MMKYILICFAAFSLCACATVNKGTSDFFRIDSVPQGAVATTSIETDSSRAARRENSQIEPQYIGCSPTPCAIKLNRREEFIITLEHPEFETAEMFITNSRQSGSFTANMAMTGATVSGTAAATAIVGAGIGGALSALTVGATNASIAATATLGTFGLIPIETSLAYVNSVVVAPTVSTSSALSASIPPALIITGGSLLIDAASGANVNLYPNPVVLKLAPKGTPTKTDPNVAVFRADIEEGLTLQHECEGRRTPSADRIRRCRNLITKRLSRDRKRDALAASKAEQQKAKEVEEPKASP